MLVTASSLAACGKTSSRHAEVKARGDTPACDFVSNPASAPTSPPSEPPSSNDEILHTPPLQTDPRLGSPRLTAGETGAWLVGVESLSHTTGQATFVEAASGRERRTCAIPPIEEVQVATWGDRLIVAGLDCSGCSKAVPIITVLDPSGAVTFTWRAKEPEDPDLFGTEIMDVGDSAAIIIKHGRRGPNAPIPEVSDSLVRLQLKPDESEISAVESVIAKDHPLLCPTEKGLVAVEHAEATADRPSFAPVTLSFVDPATLEAKGPAMEEPANDDRFAAPSCTGDGVAVVGVEGIASWTPAGGWTHLKFESARERYATVATEPRLIVNDAGVLKIPTARGWEPLHGKPATFLLASASAHLAAVMDPHTTAAPTFTKLT